MNLDSKKYAEEKVDSMRKRKDEELEHYKKEIERAKRFEQSKGGSPDKPMGERKTVVGSSGSRGPVQRVKVNR